MGQEVRRNRQPLGALVNGRARIQPGRHLPIPRYLALPLSLSAPNPWLIPCQMLDTCLLSGWPPQASGRSSAEEEASSG